MTVVKSEGVKTSNMKDLLVVVVCNCCGTIFKQSSNYKLMDNETSLMFGKGKLFINNSNTAKQIKCGTCGYKQFEFYLVSV